MSLPLVVAITGATGVIYGVEMLRALKTLGQETHLILSEAAVLNLAIETDCDLDYVKGLANVVYKQQGRRRGRCQRLVPHTRDDRRGAPNAPARQLQEMAMMKQHVRAQYD